MISPYALRKIAEYNVEGVLKGDHDPLLRELLILVDMDYLSTIEALDPADIPDLIAEYNKACEEGRY